MVYLGIILMLLPFHLFLLIRYLPTYLLTYPMLFELGAEGFSATI